MSPEANDILSTLEDIQKRINVVLVGANKQNTDLPSQDGGAAGGGVPTGAVPQTPDQLAAILQQQQAGQQVR
jgi:hypothetical protein